MKEDCTTDRVLSLAGEWSCRLDPNLLGEMRSWYLEDLTVGAHESIVLPNTLDTAGVGPDNHSFERGKPARKKKYEGCAWFQRWIDIPDAWKGQRIEFTAERCSRASRVWVDGVPAGKCDSISAPHRYDLTGVLSPGRHLLTVEVENTYDRSYGAGVFIGRWSSAICDDLQTNWLGLLGRLELKAKPTVSLSECRVLPDPGQGKTSVCALVQNETGKPVSGTIAFAVSCGDGTVICREEKNFSSAERTIRVEWDAPMQGAPLWSEETPALCCVDAQLRAEQEENVFCDSRRERFGYRRFSRSGTHFTLNGSIVFLRGSVEYTGFPSTGHPPVQDRGGWEKIFRTGKEYGLNHFRCHSCCPPEIAFEVADELGILLQVEVPVWPEKPGSGEQPELLDFIEREARRIVETYGNHPSFVMLCLGNEYQSHFDELDAILRSLKEACPDKLYTFSTNFVCDQPTPESDYFISSRTAGGQLRVNSRDPQGRFQGYSDGTTHDYSEVLSSVDVPVVAHELGQWITFPNFSYLKKYEGTIFDPHSARELSEQLARSGLEGWDSIFQQASGTFSWLLYKEEIETALRTPELAGFQLLSLTDSPGWGEAFTGALDPFWAPKGFLTGREMRRFCSDVTPLLRMETFLYRCGGEYKAQLQVVNYSQTDLQADLIWRITGENGVLAKGEFPQAAVPKGGVHTVGEISVSLAEVRQAGKYTVSAALAGTEYENAWNFWVYPEPVLDSQDIYVCRELDAQARQRLENGESVLWMAENGSCRMQEMRFLPEFWSLWWFWWDWRDQEVRPTTMGIVCDPSHPLFNHFPTGSHSDFQWWDILEKQPAFWLDPGKPQPEVLLRVIDDYHVSRPLAAIVQTRVGRGRLLACSLDLLSRQEERPASAQLYASMLAYMKSERFAPQCDLTFEQLQSSVRFGNRT